MGSGKGRGAYLGRSWAKAARPRPSTCATVRAAAPARSAPSLPNCPLHPPCLALPPFAQSTHQVRDALRRAMAAAPDAWDWAAARVPSALTDELEAAQAVKKAEKRARQKALLKERSEVSEEKKAEAAAAAKAAMEEEIARAAAEAAAMSLRCVC
ncbi:MAG: hypothetical protein J3K34DRAFT_177346 [Monoraphidium minutum]|nr:MAG: hypothetical protein J3K34DRAFT_177346 [Monoraphidium minutum]